MGCGASKPDGALEPAPESLPNTPESAHVAESAPAASIAMRPGVPFAAPPHGLNSGSTGTAPPTPSSASISDMRPVPTEAVVPERGAAALVMLSGADDLATRPGVSSADGKGAGGIASFAVEAPGDEALGDDARGIATPDTGKQTLDEVAEDAAEAEAPGDDAPGDDARGMAEPESGKQTLDEVVEGAAEAEVSTECSAATPSIQQQVAESAPVPLWLAALRKEWEITGVHTSIVKIESDQFDAATPRSIIVTILPMS